MQRHLKNCKCVRPLLQCSTFLLRHSSRYREIYDWMSCKKWAIMSGYQTALKRKISYCIEQSPSSGIEQEFTHRVWNPRVYCNAHNSQPLEPILSQFNPVHAIITYCIEICFSIIMIKCKQFSWLVPSFQVYKLKFLFSFSHFNATCAVLVIILEFLALIILYGKCNYIAHFT